MSNSKLATVQRISEVVPHHNADTLDIIKVLGWTCVAKKGEFEAGDLCVYVALDAILPERPEFEFLRNKSFRIKTIKLRGVVSQGICFPIDVIPGRVAVCEGYDVTDRLGVAKYEKPVPKCQDALGHFPTHLVSKTDEERVQNVPSLVDQLRNQEIYVSVKHDGTSATFIKQDGELRVCSRNMELKDGNNVYWNMARLYHMDDNIPEGFVVQGEIIGPGIQGNREGLEAPMLRVFNVVNADGHVLNYRETVVFCQNHHFHVVQLNYVGPNKFNSLEELISYADGVRYENNKNRAEGIVVRLADGRHNDELGKPFSFKVISNKYALKHGE